jgi:hypothetical protein
MTQPSDNERMGDLQGDNCYPESRWLEDKIARSVKQPSSPGDVGGGEQDARVAFERAYAERSGVTVEWLHERGEEVRPCVCDWDDCQGWQMARVRGQDWPEWSPFPKSDPRFTAYRASKKAARRVQLHAEGSSGERRCSAGRALQYTTYSGTGVMQGPYHTDDGSRCAHSLLGETPLDWLNALEGEIDRAIDLCASRRLGDRLANALSCCRELRQLLTACSVPNASSPPSEELSSEGGEDLGPHRTKVSLISEVRTLRSRLTVAEQENFCGVCGGNGKPISGKRCICNGTGKAYMEAQGLREELVRESFAREAAERALESARQDTERLRLLAEHLQVAAIWCEDTPTQGRYLCGSSISVRDSFPAGALNLERIRTLVDAHKPPAARSSTAGETHDDNR